MSTPIVDALKAVGGPLKTLFVDKIQDYIKFIKTYDDNMNALMEQLENLHATKVRIDTEVTEGEANLRVMTMETINWLERFVKLIKKEELKRLMKEERVAENVVRMMEHGVLKKLWKEDREIFDIVVRVVKKKCDRQPGDGEVLDAREDADYNKVAKIASDVMKDIAEEFNKFLKTDDAAVAVVKLLNDEDLEKLAKDGDEMAMLLGKAEGIVRNKIKDNDHGEEELLLPKHEKDVQLDSKNTITEKVGNWRKHMGSLMTFLDDEKFRKGLPDGANLGLEVMDVLSKSSGSELVEENGKSHRYCGWCVVRFESHRHHHDMSELAEIMVESIKTLINGYPVGRVTRRKRGDELENIPGDFKVGLESREQLVQKILIALRDDKVNVVGVYGMGGGGKTTLAKEVADKRATDLFNKRVVVEVSEAPNIKGIQDQIAEGINMSLEDVQSVPQRARNLYNSLKSQKILIVLDNVWKKLNLNEVGIPRESTKDFYCKLLITTREEEVCKDMDVKDDNIFEVGMLNEKEALDLFQNKTGEKVESQEFKQVVDRLLRKCAGLPLAIVATSSALRGKKLPMWLQFAESSEKPISCQVSSEYREIYSILETSYKLMDIKEKRIFFFLACLSPLDSAIAVGDLMRYGIGLDLFQRVNSLSDAMKQASEWAEELVSSSLLLKDDSDGLVKIHDVVRASAISFIDKGNDRVILVESIPRWMSRQAFKKFKAISLLSGSDFSRLSGVKAPMLQILLLKGDISSTSLQSNFFVGMKNLKVLSLSNMNFSLALPESMGQLDRLKTLHLHNCILGDIKLIGKLVNLLVLSLRGSSLHELAFEIGDMCKLRLLDMNGCKGLKSIPANILSRLSHLEGLYMLNGFDGWASTYIEVNNEHGYDQASGSELNTLSHLNVLEMEVPKVEQILTISDDVLVERLCKFRVRVGDYYNRDRKFVEMAKVSSFRYVLELDDIGVSKNNGLKALLKKTECLQVLYCDIRTENFVPQLDEDGFRNLKYLDVMDKGYVECLISSDEQEESPAFANLEILRLGTLENLEMICDGKAPLGIFANLRCLTLLFLPYLKCGLPLTLVQLKLSEVSIEDCPRLQFIVNKDASVPENETDTVWLPLLKSLDLKRAINLSGVLGQRNEMFECGPAADPFFNAKNIYPSLENLKLSENYTIVTLWSQACSISSFQNLKVLNISYCSELQNLGFPSIFTALVQLEELSLLGCYNLEEVITKEAEGPKLHEDVISFPQLKHLFLESLPKFERFYGGSYKLEFPKLKSLKLSNAEKLTNLDRSEDSFTFFSDKIKFPCLEELEVQMVSNEVVRLWNWSSSVVHGENRSASIPSNPVPNLLKLTLGQNHGLTFIPAVISQMLSYLLVTNFSDVKMLFSILAPRKEAFWEYSQFTNLQKLSVSNCDCLEQLFENEDDAGVLMLCERLRLTEISLEKMPKLKMLPLHLLKNIHSLILSELKWKYVFSADLFITGREQLQQLENLEIIRCENMEVIIMDEVARDGEEKVYGFPRLKTLKLNYLQITNFASKPSTALLFQSLERVKLYNCPYIQSFCSGPFTAPKLKGVAVGSCDDMQFFLSGKINDVRELPSLETLEVKSCYSLVSFSSHPLVAPKLQAVKLEQCGQMKWAIPGDPNIDDDILEMPSLECVYINECDVMQSFSSAKVKAPKLCTLEVEYKDYSKRANDELQHLLGKLDDCFKRGEDDDDDEDEDEDDEDEDDGDEDKDGEEDEEEEEDLNDCGDGEAGELETKRSEGSQDEQNMDGDEDEDMADLRSEYSDGFQEEQITEGEGDEELEDSDRPQEEQITEGDEELEELRTEDIDGSQKEQIMERGGK